MPDYANSVMNISISILKHYGVETEHPTIPELDVALSKGYKNVVFIVIDGMGTDLLNYHLPEESTLRKHKVKDITSVFPSTTPVATTSMYSGLSPLEHGWVGCHCYFKETGQLLDLYSHKDPYTQEKEPTPGFVNNVMGYKTINEKISDATDGKVETHEIFPPFKPNGVVSTTEMFFRIKDLCALEGHNFILAYWDNPDTTIHKVGCYVPKVKDILKQIDDELKDAVSSIKNTLIVIAADHGQVDMDENVFLDEITDLTECFAMPPAFGKRNMSFSLKPDKKDVFKKRFNELFEDDFLLVPKDQFIDLFLGPGKQHPRIEDFVGDFVAVAVGKKMFQYRTSGNPIAKPIMANHAGLTHEEMIVPLIIIECP